MANTKTSNIALSYLAFRPGFLLASVFAIVSIAAWWYQLETGLWFNEFYTPHWWHAHEMLLGFAMPVIVGFLLTAVQNWSGVPGTKSWPLALMFCCWLYARVTLLLWPAGLWWAFTLETVFILLAAFELLQRLWPKRQWQNLPMVVVLLLMATFNTLSYQAANDAANSAQIHYALLWLFMLLITAIGGRVIPFFTARKLGTEQVKGLPVLEALCLLLSLAIALSLALKLATDSTIFHTLIWLTGIAHAYRWLRWQHTKVYRIPMLWSLHLSYLLLPVACLILALNFNHTIFKSAIHLLSIGVMSGLILSMMARVTLGHTGRSLQLPKAMPIAFGLILIAALVRSLLPLFAPEFTLLAWRLAAGMWIFAFLLFIFHYAPMLLLPRADGKEG